MANHAYASLWTKGFSAATLLKHWEALLSTVPFSATRPGFTALVARAVDSAEPPFMEVDLGATPFSAVEVVELGRDYASGDCAFAAAAWWDLWVYDLEAVRWVEQPQKLEILCHGPEYDDAVCAENGHFQLDLDFEHLFTGHAGLLGLGERRAVPPQHPAEAAFLSLMSQPGNLREYQEKTQENIRRLLDWMNGIAATLPVERTLLWSEGEENFEARLDEIVAAR